MMCATPGGVAAIAALALLVAAFAIRPAPGLFLIAVTLPFYLWQKSLGSMAFSVPELVLVATLAGAAMHAVWRWRASERAALARLATPLDLPVAIFLLAAVLSLLASEVLRVSLRDLRTLIVEPVAAYYLAVWFLSRGQLPWLIGAIIAGGTAAAGLGLYQYLFTTNVVTVEGTSRMLGPYLSPNQLGLYLGRSIPLALAILLFVPSMRLPAALAALVPAIALALTFSVGAWLATLLGVAAVLALWRPRAILALSAAVVALAVAAIPILSTERFASHLSLSRGTSFIRLQLWESSIRMIQDHPILGVGMDNFLYLYRSRYILPEAAAEPNLSHPHNLVLNFWLQAGILGLAAFLWLMASLVRIWAGLWQLESDPWGKAMLAGIAGVAVDFVAHGMVDNSYFLVDMAFQFWLVAGVLVALRDEEGRAKGEKGGRI